MCNAKDQLRQSHVQRVEHEIEVTLRKAQRHAMQVAALLLVAHARWTAHFCCFPPHQ
jgi:hypothetical protein